MRIARYEFLSLIPDMPPAELFVDEEIPPPPPPPPMFDEQALAQAEQAAHMRGYEEGFNQANNAANNEAAQREQQLLRMMHELIGQLSGLKATHEAMMREHSQSMAQLVVAAAHKLTEGVVAQDAMEVVTPMLAQCLSVLLDEPKLSVTVNTALVGPMEQRLQQLAEKADFSGVLKITGDARLLPADCKLEWRSGNASRNQQSMWEEIEPLLHQAVHQLTHGKAPAEAEPAPTARAFTEAENVPAYTEQVTQEEKHDTTLSDTFGEE